MPRFAEDYGWLADRVDAILLDLLLTHGTPLHESAWGDERRNLALSLQKTLNARLEAEGVMPGSVSIRVGAASSVPSQGVFLRVMLEVIA